MWFAIYRKSDNEDDVLYDMIDRWTLEEAKKFVKNKYGEEYYCVPAPEYDPLKEFHYEGIDFDQDAAPSEEQRTSAEIDSQYEHMEHEKAKHNRTRKCIDCGVSVIYKTRPHKRCAECKLKFERERKRLARSKK